jgi:hypothetical protein
MRRHLVVMLLVGVAAAGCKGPTDPSKNTIEPPFNGTVQPLGIGSPSQSFSVPNLGEFTVSMTALTPGNVFVGIGWGMVSGGSCSLQQTNAVGPANIGRTSLSGQILLRGDYCVAVFDASLNFAGFPPLTVAQNYTVQVSHP